MNIKRAVIISLIVLLALFLTNNILIKLKDSKNLPVEQLIEEASIIVTAPPLIRNELAENSSKEKLKNNIRKIYFYQSNYKKTDYTVIFAQYTKTPDLKSGIEAIEQLYKDNNFVFTVVDNKVGDLQGMYLDGTFDQDKQKYAIKVQFIKKAKMFWQIIIIYTPSEENNITADNYINSIKVQMLSS